LRRHPEIKWRSSPEEIDRLAEQGLALLVGAAALVSPGGLLAGITCSIEPEENEQLVGRFLARCSDFALAPLSTDAVPALAGCRLASGGVSVLPAGDHDGMTAHVLRRR
jgi:16S rRNA (cytosine967-C5)-methyltransferase